jgi:hypothetical protein
VPDSSQTVVLESRTGDLVRRSRDRAGKGWDLADLEKRYVRFVRGF